VAGNAGFVLLLVADEMSVMHKPAQDALYHPAHGISQKIPLTSIAVVLKTYLNLNKGRKCE